MTTKASQSRQADSSSLNRQSPANDEMHNVAANSVDDLQIKKGNGQKFSLLKAKAGSYVKKSPNDQMANDCQHYIT
jgi:hypothetical protein